ncbi:putative NADH:ubiquinone reductase (H(+)-translocating) [Helianthus debilis subsp. tardiflorus]
MAILFFIDIHDMFPMVTEFMNYGQQTVRAARYIGQGFMIALSHANRLPVTIQYPYEKLITSECFRGRIHFEFDKCIACEVCVRVCPICTSQHSFYFSTNTTQYMSHPKHPNFVCSLFKI